MTQELMVVDWRSAVIGAVIDAALTGDDIDTEMHAYTDSMGLPRVAWMYEDGHLTGHVASTVGLNEMCRIVQRYADVLGDGSTGKWNEDGHQVLYAHIKVADHTARVQAWLGRWSR